MVGRFTATYAINVGLMIVAEVMPTELRCQGVSLANVLSMGAMMASPYIVYSVWIQSKLLLKFMIIVVSLFCQKLLLSGLLVSLLFWEHFLDFYYLKLWV